MFLMIISKESMDFNDPKELDDPQLFGDPSYLMIPSYLTIPIYLMINWKYGLLHSEGKGNGGFFPLRSYGPRPNIVKVI